MPKKILVIGAGSWGTTLSKLLAEKKLDVTLWVRELELLEKLQKTNRNEYYLPQILLPTNIKYTNDLSLAKQADIIVLVTPSHVVREICKQLAKIGVNNKIIVSCAKGLEEGAFCRMTEIIAQELPENKIAALSGPNHAENVSEKQPTATVIACADEQVARKLQRIFSTTYFRPYTNTDVIGVELAGAFKNIIALASGVLAGLGFGDNTLAGLMTRGLAEISRLGIALGAQAHTFAGLAGVGDLIATCVSKHSRNRWAGEQLGKGRSLEDILQETKMVVEGVRATQIAYKLAQVHKIDMPITSKLYEVLYEKKKARTAIKELMKRDHTKEEQFVEII